MSKSERERLTSLIMNAPKVEFPFGSRAQGKTYQTAQNIADHLLANGVIVPPCKVGDTVYSFCDVFGAILPYVVQNFGVGFMGKDRPNYWFWEATSHATETDELLDEIDFDLDNFGKTVFLTKEEAEKALKERSNR